MKIWSFQPLIVAENLQKGIPYTCDPQKALYLQEDYGFHEAYQWIIQKMREKLPHSPQENIYPAWGWQTWNNKTTKPDLRKYNGVYDNTALLELDIEAERLLLSDFSLWHDVLNNYPCDDNFDKIYTEEAKIVSWNKIFENLDDKIQATFWNILPEDVTKIHHIHRKDPRKGETQ